MLFRLNKLNILISAFYIDKQLSIEFIQKLSPYCNILIDSGAFSLFQTNKKRAAKQQEESTRINLPRYIDMCHQLDGFVFQYIMLDVIRDQAKSEINLYKMLDAGLTPMPVMIEGWADEKITELTSINSWVCVAGGVGSDHTYIKNRYNRLYQLSGKRARIHGLGYSRGSLSEIDISACDSSSWNVGSRYGTVTVFTDGKFYTQHYQKVLKSESKSVEQYIMMQLFKKYGKDAMYRQETYRGFRSLNNFCTIKAYYDYMCHCLEQGKLYFFAVPNYHWLIILIAALFTDNYNSFWELCEELSLSSENIFSLLREKTKWEQQIPTSIAP